MIYLIGGPPKCGKTTLSKALAKKHRISYISADTLQNIVFYETPDSEIETRFPHREFSKRFKNYDEMCQKIELKTIIENYLTQAETSKKAIRSIVETYLIDKESIVLEGYQIIPKLVSELKKEFGKENIREIFVLKRDQELLLEGIEQGGTKSDWILNKVLKKENRKKVVEMITIYSSMFEIDAQKYDYRCINMDKSFEEKIEYISKSL